VTKAAASSTRQLATTTFISARRALPDAFYSLAQNGNLNWEVSDDMLALSGTPGALRNVAVLLPLIQNGPELGRCYCRYPIEIQVSSGAVNLQTVLPQFTLTANGLRLNCAFIGPSGPKLPGTSATTPRLGKALQHSMLICVRGATRF
jgi:hypothetical protein